MFDYTDKSQAYLENNSCEAAIEAANIARREGELWLEWSKGDSLERLTSISGVLDLQFEAYKCKGKAAYKAGNYKEALDNYILVDAVLNELISIDSAKNAFGKVWSWNRMADCYSKLLEFEKSDSLYSLAIKQYINEERKYNEDLAYMIVGLSDNIIAQGFIGEANQIIEPIVAGFEKKNKKEVDTGGVMVLYKHLIGNLIRVGEYNKADHYLQKGFAIAIKDSLDYFELQHYSGFSTFMQGEYIEAIKSFREAKAGYAKLLEPVYGGHVGIRQALFRAYLAQANYKLAREELNEALIMVEEVHGKRSISCYKVLGDVALMDYIMAEYLLARSRLQKILEHYEQISNINDKQVEALALLAVLEAEMDNMAEAKVYKEKATSLANEMLLHELPTMAGIWLNLARVDIELQSYESAEVIYKGVVNRAGENNPVQKAEALAGLAVIDIEKGNYEIAAKRLEAALDIANNKLEKIHPTIATLHYNKSRILLHKGEIAKAQKEAAIAEYITKKLHTDNHPSHGDNYSLYGDIMIAAKQPDKAASYYKKAEDSYSKKYKKEHRKRKYVREMLQLIEAEARPLFI